MPRSADCTRAWYVAAENDTPRKIAAKLGKYEGGARAARGVPSADELVELNRSQYPELLVSSKLRKNTVLFLGAPDDIDEGGGGGGASGQGSKRAEKEGFGQHGQGRRKGPPCMRLDLETELQEETEAGQGTLNGQGKIKNVAEVGSRVGEKRVHGALSAAHDTAQGDGRRQSTSANRHLPCNIAERESYLEMSLINRRRSGCHGHASRRSPSQFKQEVTQAACSTTGTSSVTPGH